MGSPTTTNSSASSIATAIATAEGYGVPGAIPTVNNNPGDLRSWPGVPTGANGFAVFPTPEAGQAALQAQVNSMLDSTSSYYNSNMTIAQVASIYSPDGATNWANNVSAALGVSPNTTLASYVLNGPDAGSASTILNTTDPATLLGLSNTSVEAQPVYGRPITDTADLYPSYVVTEGLDAVPWWLMKGGVTENPWLKQVPAPVTFEIMLPNRKMLSNTKAGNTSGTISIQLNASVSSFEVQAGHVVNKGLSRTGMHITMWGQEADLISGEANTGAFMNALGITSFLSVSPISSQLQRQIISAFSNSSKQESNVDYSMTSNDLRIAARDAFMELLALFKANGVVWFRNSRSGTGATNPVGVDAFSPQTGLSNYQMNARTNDVMARGQVIMKFRNSMYLGYFKSLEYEMEAERPFYWKFRFVFQVEKTLTLNYIPMYTTANLQPVSTTIPTTISYVPLQPLSLPTQSLPGSVSKS